MRKTDEQEQAGGLQELTPRQLASLEADPNRRTLPEKDAGLAKLVERFERETTIADKHAAKHARESGGA